MKDKNKIKSKFLKQLVFSLIETMINASILILGIGSIILLALTWVWGLKETADGNFPYMIIPLFSTIMFFAVSDALDKT